MRIVKRGGNLKRTPLKAKSTLRRKKAKGPGAQLLDLDQYDVGKATFPAKCFARGRKAECGGRLDLHHIVEKGRIRKEVPAEFGAQLRAKRDARNLIVVCRAHHDLIHRGSVHVLETDLPNDFWQFVTAYELDGSLPRHLAEVTAKNAQEAA